MLQTVLLVRRLFVEQPVISGGLTLVVLHSLLCRRFRRSEPAVHTQFAPGILKMRRPGTRQNQQHAANQ